VYLRGGLAPSGQSAEFLSRIAIIPVGPVNGVQLLGGLVAEHRPTYRSLAVVDGGKSVTVGCISLPGAPAPERLGYEGPVRPGQ
jgi:hypothetical protein